MKTIIIIPTYDERENIEELIPKIFKVLPDANVLIIDDNSPDRTGEIAEKLKINYLGKLEVIHRNEKLGHGTAYIEGFRYALNHMFDYIFTMDADLSHDPEYLPQFLEKIKEYDLVIGSRYLHGVSVVNWPLRRLIFSVLATKYTQLITGLKLSDCTSGFKCFRREVLEKIDLDKIISNGYSFHIELNYKTNKLGFKMGQIPIIFVDRKCGKSKISMGIIREALWVILKIRLGL